MKKEILTDAIELITKDCKDNVNKTKNYDEYLNAMTEKELDNIITLYSSMQYDEEELDLMYGILKENSKDRKIAFLLKNLNKIVELEIEVFMEALINDIMKIIYNDGYIEYTIESLEIFINHIIILRKLGFIFVNMQNGKIKIHMPKEVLKVAQSKITSMQIKGIDVEKTNINEFIRGFLNAYGMINNRSIYSN